MAEGRFKAEMDLPQESFGTGMYLQEERNETEMDRNQESEAVCTQMDTSGGRHETEMDGIPEGAAVCTQKHTSGGRHETEMDGIQEDSPVCTQKDTSDPSPPDDQPLSVLVDDFKSLKAIIHRREYDYLRRPRPVRVYISTSCADCWGPGHEDHFGHLIRKWRNSHSYDASEPEHADIIVVEGPFPEDKKAKVFTAIPDHRMLPFTPHDTDARYAAMRLHRLIRKERRRTKDVHYYTYQQYGKRVYVPPVSRSSDSDD